MGEKRLANGAVIRKFAIGQLGWAILSGIISNWLVYYYMPSETLVNQGMTGFITQGIVFAGLTVIGIITACGRLLDGFIDPFIASKSDSLASPLGRRIPFMRKAAAPFAAMTVLVFVIPGTSSVVANIVLLFVCLMLFYVTLSLYCTPFNALIPELGRTQELRVNLSTYISVTYFVGTAAAYLVTALAGILEPSLGPVTSFRVTVAMLAVVALACMLVPAFGIDENLYADTQPSSTPMGQSVAKTFKNREFQIFESSDVLLGVDHDVPDGPAILRHGADGLRRFLDVRFLRCHDAHLPLVLRTRQLSGKAHRQEEARRLRVFSSFVSRLP